MMFVRWNLTVFSLIHSSLLIAFVLRPRESASSIVSSRCVSSSAADGRAAAAQRSGPE